MNKTLHTACWQPWVDKCRITALAQIGPASPSPCEVGYPAGGSGRAGPGSGQGLSAEL